MKTYFDEATDKRLLEAQTEEEVKAIIAETPEAEKLADKTELIMDEIKRLKGTLDEELDLDELDSAAGGAKLTHINLSPSQSCVATFYLQDLVNYNTPLSYCTSNDFCNWSNEYKYHYSIYSNCKKGGKHEWVQGTYTDHEVGPGGVAYADKKGQKCQKCGLTIFAYEYDDYNFDR